MPNLADGLGITLRSSPLARGRQLHDQSNSVLRSLDSERLARSPKTQPAPPGAGCPLPPHEPLSLRTGVEHRDRPAVLRPARYVVAHRDRALLAVGNRAHAL